MINGLQLLKQFDEHINSGELTNMQQKILAGKYAELLLSELQIGDTVEGLIAKMGDNKYVLQVEPHVNIPVQMFEQLELGKLMTFLGQGKENGKLYLQPSYQAEQKETPLVQKTLQELSLPKTPAMKEVVDNFLQKHLPLAKEMLLKAYQASNEYDIPSKIVTNLIDKQVFSSKEAGTLSALRANGMDHIVTDLKSVVQGLNYKDDLIKVFNTLKESVPVEKISAILQEITDEIAKPNIQRDTHKVLTEGVFKEISQTPLVPKEVKVLDTSINEEISKMLNNIADKEAIGQTEGLLKRLVGKVYDEAVLVRLQDIKGDLAESEKIYNTYNTLAKLLKTLDKTDLSKEDKDYLNYVKEPLGMLGKLNAQAEYFVFPMLQDNKQTQAELYFFKPKKTTKKNKDNMYIVLALSLPNINNIEIHINKQEKNILLSINVENEEIQKHILQYMPKFNEDIQDLGFSVSKVTWGLISRESSIRSTGEDDLQYQFHHMDFKV